jgi:hypothetical protein
MLNTINFLDEIQKLEPSAAPAAKMPNKQVQRQSLDDARAKVAAKALRSKSDYVPVDDDESKDDIYKYDDHTGNYRVGLKHGNRWLKHDLFDGNSYIEVDSREAVDRVIDQLVGWVEAEHFDEAIEEIRKVNVGRKRK